MAKHSAKCHLKGVCYKKGSALIHCSEVRSCVKVKVAVLGSPSLISLWFLWTWSNAQPKKLQQQHPLLFSLMCKHSSATNLVAVPRIVFLCQLLQLFCRHSWRVLGQLQVPQWVLPLDLVLCGIPQLTEKTDTFHMKCHDWVRLTHSISVVREPGPLWRTSTDRIQNHLTVILWSIRIDRQTQWCLRFWSSLAHLNWQNADHTSQREALRLMDSATHQYISAHNCTHWYPDTLMLTSICTHHWYPDTLTFTSIYMYTTVLTGIQAHWYSPTYRCIQLYSLVSGHTDTHQHLHTTALTGIWTHWQHSPTYTYMYTTVLTGIRTHWHSPT